MRRVVVIGAGVGGLTAAAVLARAGLDVTVLEAQVYPGGCASTYYHQGYRFDTGATLAGGFYPGGPMDLVARAAGIDSWPARPADAAMVVHLPGGTSITRWTGAGRWDAYRAAFGERCLDFFRWQEQAADAVWDLALRLPPWPPQSARDGLALLAAGVPWLVGRGPAAFAHLPALALDAFRPLAARLSGASELFRLFIDAQLLISAQAASDRANALYAAAALDLPRRGVVHLAGGMGAIAETLADAVRRQGGRVLYRHEVTRIRVEGGHFFIVETKRGEAFPADLVIANLTPWNAAHLLPEEQIPALRRLMPRPPRLWSEVPADAPRPSSPEEATAPSDCAPSADGLPFPSHPAAPSDAERPQELRSGDCEQLGDAELLRPDGWGAFVVYVGLEGSIIPAGFPLHHQVVLGRPLGEGNTVFASLSPEWDAGRAPAGCRALTLSTHTALEPWWQLYQHDREGYAARKAALAETVLAAAEVAMPGLRAASRLVLPGTPVTFQRFTRRAWGWVGGFPQTSLLRSFAPRLAPNLWLVGDSIFPGQSTAAVALGGLRVAHMILQEG